VTLDGCPAPSKIVGVERNYAGPRARPRLFLRPLGCLIGPGEPIVLPVLPETASKVVAQCELGAVVGERLAGVSVERAAEGLLGYTCLNDVTAIELFLDPEVGIVSKWFDTFMPIGPALVPRLPEGGARMTCSVNGETRLEGHTSEFAVGIPQLVSWISRYTALLPGDIVMCGGPPNQPAIAGGDEVVVAIEGIGELRNPVVGATG
jgi:2-keto-4-pentenoate hydratase/2-oxohepta-3-ene-1,7-dioic acid hydratase in catechol pathway